MVKTLPETIILKGDPNRYQWEAGGTVTPGDLLELNSSANVIRHNSAGREHGRMFAVENDIGGDEITDDYASGEVVQVQLARPGDSIFARLNTSQTITIGEFLESAGDGTLQAFVADSNAIAPEEFPVGFAIQAVTTTSSESRIKIIVV